MKRHLTFRQAAAVLAGAVVFFATPSASAIAFLHSGANGNPDDPFTSDTLFNSTRPVDDKGQPWDSVGFYKGAGGGTAISSRWFVSASHVGNDGFFTLPDNNPLSNDDYTVIANYQLPGTDVTFHKVDRDLPSFTALYAGNPFADLTPGNTPLLLIGDGYERTTPRFLNTQNGSLLMGWDVGGQRAKRWALNNLDALNDEFDPGDPWWRSKFKDNTFGDSEGQVAGGDSGGGAFVKLNGQWRLLGPISYALVYGDPFFPEAMIERQYLTQNGLMTLGTESAGYIPGLQINTILANVDIPDPRAEAVPEAGGFCAAAGLAGAVALRWKRKKTKSSGEGA